MKAGALVVGLVLMLVVPARAQHGGGGHPGGFGGGHFGAHFGGHRGHGSSGNWGSRQGGFSGSALSHVVGPPRLTSFVGFGSAPGFGVFFVTDSFFCPFVRHLIFPFCRFCPRPFGVFGGGFFGFPGFGFLDDAGTWLGSEGVYSQPATPNPPPAGSSQPVRPVLVFTNGWSFEVTDYWIDDEGELRYVTTYGGMNIVALQSLDLYATVKRNAERGIPFTLKLRPGQ